MRDVDDDESVEESIGKDSKLQRRLERKRGAFLFILGNCLEWRWRCVEIEWARRIKKRGGSRESVLSG
jgi:hypothetical protein